MVELKTISQGRKDLKGCLYEKIAIAWTEL